MFLCVQWLKALRGKRFSGHTSFDWCIIVEIIKRKSNFSSVETIRCGGQYCTQSQQAPCVAVARVFPGTRVGPVDDTTCPAVYVGVPVLSTTAVSIDPSIHQSSSRDPQAAGRWRVISGPGQPVPVVDEEKPRAAPQQTGRGCV
jgi:hypothetical protein